MVYRSVFSFKPDVHTKWCASAEYGGFSIASLWSVRIIKVNESNAIHSDANWDEQFNRSEDEDEHTYSSYQTMRMAISSD